jgi:hypothetical protein
MLRVGVEVVADVHKAASPHELCRHLQAAIQLEHATIPPYLTAWFSLRENTNMEIRLILSGIFMDEMLHMAIVANVMNAIGGRPVLNSPDFVPRYPGRLPMNVDPGLVVGLKKLSKELIRDTFMSIEEPEDPDELPVRSLAGVQPPGQRFATIGQFYSAIIDRITALGEPIFIADPSRQFVDPISFPERDLFPVVDVESAVRALRLIVEQGEGSPRKPINPDGEVAHYYRFAQIVHGRRLVPAATAAGYAYAGDAVPFDASSVINIVENSKAVMYPPGSPAREAVDSFNATYTGLLEALHDTFNGQLGRYDDATDGMTRLTGLARQITALEISDGIYAAPSFEPVPPVGREEAAHGAA